ncbi:hypothetical protein [Helicobacter himalayensis]|uniref:hypothetical protein n=1 Tax=Helicobacter himalayensis TaxID=1591088 RepID=UPI00083695AC|nr:hypothetical protein [Helicobacter himalayensis]
MAKRDNVAIYIRALSRKSQRLCGLISLASNVQARERQGLTMWLISNRAKATKRGREEKPLMPAFIAFTPRSCGSNTYTK